MTREKTFTDITITQVLGTVFLNSYVMKTIISQKITGTGDSKYTSIQVGRDKLIYAYDQTLCLKTIPKALSQAKIHISSAIRVLNVGCGTCDLVWQFTHREEMVTGIDVSNKVIG